MQISRGLGVLALVCVGNPYILFGIPFLLAAFAHVRNAFVAASRAVKRLETAARPPILSLFAETLSGLPVIRALDAVARLRGQFAATVDAHSRPWTVYYYITRWLG